LATPGLDTAIWENGARVRVSTAFSAPVRIPGEKIVAAMETKKNRPITNGITQAYFSYAFSFRIIAMKVGNRWLLFHPLASFSVERGSKAVKEKIRNNIN
jgi:hypothetical protein